MDNKQIPSHDLNSLTILLTNTTTTQKDRCIYLILIYINKNLSITTFDIISLQC